MLVTRREELMELYITTVNRLHEVLTHLIPGGVGKKLRVDATRSLLSGVRPRDTVGKARKQMALDYLADLERLTGQMKELKKQITKVLDERSTSLLEVDGIGHLGAGKTLTEVYDVGRFPSRHHFASYTGTAPIDVSSGDNDRHRLNRGGNRRLNHVVHIAAVTQARMPGAGQDYYRRKRAEGKTHLEALRCLKRRISDSIYRALLSDLKRAEALASPGGQVGASLQSSATDLIPMASTSEQSLPRLDHDPTPDLAVVS